MRPALPAVLAAALAALTVAAGAPVVHAQPAAGPRSPDAVLVEATARATLDRWLKAQNEGRYQDYAALYAPGFTGVKRVGTTTRKMKRAAWLKDRKAMFKARMYVHAAGVKVTPAAGGGAVIELTQTWEQGAFADRGPKRIAVDAAGLITSEELLSSRRVLTETACLTALYPGSSLKKRITGPDDGARPVLLVSPRDLGDRSSCRVEVESDGGVAVTLGVLAFQKKWVVEAVLDTTYAVEKPADDGDEYQDGEVTMESAVLHPDVPVVEVVEESRRGGPQYLTTLRTTTLYRVDGDRFQSLLSWESGGSSGEADDVTACELETLDTDRAGWPDLELTCTRSAVQWAAGETTPEETTETTRYRWDGSAYDAQP